MQFKCVLAVPTPLFLSGVEGLFLSGVEGLFLSGVEGLFLSGVEGHPTPYPLPPTQYVTIRTQGQNPSSLNSRIGEEDINGLFLV
jgi:hypothetical protein